MPNLPSTRRVMNNPMSVLRDLDRAIGQAWTDVETNFSSSGNALSGGGFAVDIREQENELLVEAELPGFKKDEINVSVEQGVLSIEATSKTEKSDKDSGEVHVSERSTRHLSRRFTLPSSYDSNNVDASLEDGILTLKLPKREEVKPRKVEVK